MKNDNNVHCADEKIETSSETTNAATQASDETSSSSNSDTSKPTNASAKDDTTTVEACCKDKIVALEAELSAAKTRYIHLMADFDNMRKRQARETIEITARANEHLLKAMMPVFDHFEMALQASTQTQSLESFATGIKMIASEFKKVLEQEGAELLEASEGSDVDPMIHQVLTTVPHATIPAGKVVSQYRKGWKLGGKIVRPVDVTVSAGAPATDAQEEK